MIIETITKIFLPVYFIVFNTMVFILPSYIVYKRTGKNPYVFGKSKSLHDRMGRLSRMIVLLLFVVICIDSFLPAYYKYLIPLSFLEKEIIWFAGIIFLFTSLIWTMIAVKQMRDSWRIGLDQVNKTELITNRLFKFSRNPVFLGMAISVIGLFLILPNIVTLLSLVSYLTFSTIQIHLEEEFLINSFGGEYLNYKTKVKRWI